MKQKTNLNEANLIQALRLGLIDWFQFLEQWRKLDEPTK